ncbi:hypothetical protein [Brevundimonas sp. UBA2416]|uniref:hypothetical protein n=1 Tax=Brevundimonas sp. UBA2416 TaxID=1946124 RepID=UPI0025B8E66E|nr:hypothetical protein [Brevundimonas sp. UBA2416]HRJ63435.1 hypothetical protein [Brevundimonas sp.]
MKSTLQPPNEPGRWTLLEHLGATALWRRDRTDPVPVTMFYPLNPPLQGRVVYDEAEARQLYSQMTRAGRELT